MTKLLLIALGGAGGALLRWSMAGLTQYLTGASFPYGTLVVNVLGCLLMGFLGFALTGPLLVREAYRLAILVGLLGSLTTFSTFGWETFELLNDGQVGRAATNVLATNAAAIGAVWVGYRIAEYIYGVS